MNWKKKECKCEKPIVRIVIKSEQGLTIDRKCECGGWVPEGKISEMSEDIDILNTKPEDEE